MPISSNIFCLKWINWDRKGNFKEFFKFTALILITFKIRTNESYVFFSIKNNNNNQSMCLERKINVSNFSFQVYFVLGWTWLRKVQPGI